jgi:hypothetical protein
MDNTFANLLAHKLISPIQDIKTIIINNLQLAPGQSSDGIFNKTFHLVLQGPINSKVELTFENGPVITVMIGNTMIYDVPVQDDNPIVRVKYLEDNSGTLDVQYDSSSRASYPLLYNGKLIVDMEQSEHATQFRSKTEDIIKIIAPNDENTPEAERVDNFNIIALTLSAKTKLNVANLYTDVTLHSDAQGNLYTKDAIMLSPQDFKVKIRFSKNEEETVIDLANHTIYENGDLPYPTGWKIDSFGNMTLTCEAF